MNKTAPEVIDQLLISRRQHLRPIKREHTISTVDSIRFSILAIRKNFRQNKVVVGAVLVLVLLIPVLLVILVMLVLVHGYQALGNRFGIGLDGRDGSLGQLSGKARDGPSWWWRVDCGQMAIWQRKE